MTKLPYLLPKFLNLFSELKQSITNIIITRTLWYSHSLPSTWLRPDRSQVEGIAHHHHKFNDSLPHYRITMEAKTIQIRVRAEAASEEDQRKVEGLLSFQIGDLTQPQRSLKEITDSMCNYAQSQGLTPEILESILKD